MAHHPANIAANKRAKRNREALRLLGFDTRSLTAAEIAEGGELVRKVTACGCGANSRRPKAIADWRVWAEQRSNIRAAPDRGGPFVDTGVVSADCGVSGVADWSPPMNRKLSAARRQQSPFDPKTGAFAVNIARRQA
jgi:hypothetical protein